MNKQILEQLTALFEQVFEGEVPCESLSESTLLVEDLGMNSIGFLYMAMAAEEAFGVRFENTDFEDLHTVGDVVRLIEQRQ